MTTLLPRLAYFLKDFKWYLLILILSIFLSLLTLLKITKSTQKLNKNLLLSITASIISLIFLFIFSEAYFRYIYNTSDGIGYLLVNQKWYQRHVQYNGDFLRDKEFVTSKPKGEFRIAAIGDSITFDPEVFYRTHLRHLRYPAGYPRIPPDHPVGSNNLGIKNQAK